MARCRKCSKTCCDCTLCRREKGGQGDICARCYRLEPKAWDPLLIKLLIDRIAKPQ